MSRFLCLEGMDGAGKSTQLELLRSWLTGRGWNVVLCRDPGGTSISEQIRHLLLSPPPGTEIAFRTEMLLYMASRSQLVEEVIRPALLKGSVVLCDRFLLSTVVYQGHAGGLDAEMIWRVGAEAAAGVLPGWIGVLDLPPEESIRRRQGPPDRIEQRSLDYYQRVRAGYQTEGANRPGQICLIDATASREKVHEEIVREVSRALQA
ncbi:dTMP kinase [bacterium]|nr:dTMP kinase [bacterium]